jgi:hypothetical protein
VLKALLTRLDAVEKDLQRERNRQEKTLVSDTPATILASIKHMIDPHETERKTREKLIDGHIKAHKQLKENRTLLESIPSVGKVISQRMLMLLGAYQFEDAHQCAAYLRLIPVKKNRAAVSRDALNWLRTAIKPFALNCTWQRSRRLAITLMLKPLYDRLVKKGKSKMSALGAAMRKMVHIFLVS